MTRKKIKKEERYKSLKMKKYASGSLDRQGIKISLFNWYKIL